MAEACDTPTHGGRITVMNRRLAVAVGRQRHQRCAAAKAKIACRMTGEPEAFRCLELFELNARIVSATNSGNADGDPRAIAVLAVILKRFAAGDRVFQRIRIEQARPHGFRRA